MEISVSPCDNYLAIGFKNGSVMLYDLVSKKI